MQWLRALVFVEDTYTVPITHMETVHYSSSKVLNDPL